MGENVIEACLTCGQRIPVEQCPYAWGCPKGIESELPPKPLEVLQAFEQVARLAELPIPPGSLSFVALHAPHRRPSRLPSGRQAVYSFFLGNRCLKVGRAGPKSAARYCSQHYGNRARSTLAKSILGGRDRVVTIEPWRESEIRALNESTIGPWLEANTRRLDFLMPDNAAPFAPALLEAFVQARFKPTFEG